MLGAKEKRSAPRPRRDWGRVAAIALCVVFAIVGAVPLALGVLVRTARVQAWAARETAALLRDELGVSARYAVHMQAWPLMIALEDVVVDASDGGGPFLEVERVGVRPRLFSLLAGEIDAGDVEIIGPRVRAVIAGGELRNLAFKPPESKGGGGGPERAPLSSIEITDARFDLDIEGVRAVARGVDLDVSAEEGSAFEIALRAGRTTISRAHATPGREDLEDSVDEDVICRFDTRVRVEPGSVLVRRLTLQGSADFDPDPGTAPSCRLSPGDWRAVEIELGALRLVGLDQGAPTRASGRVRARVPAALAHRFVDLPHATGAVVLDVEAEYEAGARLPRVEGTIEADRPGIDGKVFATSLRGKVSTTGEAIRLEDAQVAWADGMLKMERVEVRPFAEGVPLKAGPITLEDVELPGLLRDLGAHPRAHVAWTLREGRFDHFGGTLSPLALEGPLTVQTRGFEIFDKPTTDPARRHMMGVKEGTVHGTFQVRPSAIVLSNFAVDTPRSHLRTTVSLGFESVLDIEVYEGSKVDLADVSPIASIEMAGVADLRVGVHGPFDHPKILGELAIERFAFGGFPVGDVEPSRVTFEPLVLRLDDARIRHGQSRIRAPSVRIAFDAGADVVVDADVDTREAPGLALKDFKEIFRFDKDPRFAAYDGTALGTARVRYALGGREDRCGGGLLSVRAAMRAEKVKLFGESFDDGDMDLDLVWDDQEAGSDGMRIDLRSAALRKGSGTVLASASVRHGGVVKGSATVSGIPLGRLDALGRAGPLFDGSVSMVATIGGTLARMEGAADVQVSRVRIGPSSLPASRLSLAIVPAGAAPKVLGRTRCGNPRTAPFDIAEYEKDLPSGEFQVNGGLFGGQVTLDNVRITQQDRKVVTGKVRADGLDLGKLANLIPGVAFTAAPPKGSLTAALDIEKLPLADPRRAAMTLSLEALEVERSGRKLRLASPSGPIRLAANELDVPELRLEGRTASGLSATFVAGGQVRKAVTAPELDLGVRVEPTSLSRLGADIPAIKRASGTVQADLRVTGPIAQLRYAGAAELKDGTLDVEGLPVALDQIDVGISIGGGEVRLKRASARLGAGTITATGRMPIRGLTLGTAQAAIVARGVRLPVAEGVNLTADADLDASFHPSLEGEEGDAEAQSLPDVRGTISLTSFSYTRPIAMSVDLGGLTGRQRTDVKTYDPAGDVVRFDVNIVSPKPLRFSNNLVDMKLEVSPPGLTLSGTNQRFGARGLLRILPDSKLTLRTTEFDVREGHVRFDDPYRIAPKVDVRAETEYRRYGGAASEPAAAEGGAAAPGGSAGAGSPASTSGQWRIKLHAHGDVEDLRLALTSDPALSQEDIVLLLTLGMTRAEIDRGLATSLGETVGLEALSTLTGADKAVKTIVPLIDEFRFGSGYSSRTGRSEPTVTLGKRITDDVRANVTTGLTESREVRSSVEWRLNQRMSVQGSYDNANDASSSSLGNLGADLRWRLEFE
ncbi:MAG: translocation/assembly module TamB domain-containing protein [Polyangiaceae bacterium]|nr:translocation/assembly module TamB domain-containing protein [Polyangiaceae bacterium]